MAGQRRIGLSLRISRNLCGRCPLTFTQPGLVTVLDGEIESVIDPAEGSTLDSAHYLTINGLFDELQRALDYPAVQITVGFDDALSYPTNIFIDYSERVIDEERGFTASGLHIIPEPVSAGAQTRPL